MINLQIPVKSLGSNWEVELTEWKIIVVLFELELKASLVKWLTVRLLSTVDVHVLFTFTPTAGLTLISSAIFIFSFTH